MQILSFRDSAEVEQEWSADAVLFSEASVLSEPPDVADEDADGA